MKKQELIEKYKKKYSGESMSFLATVLLNEILRDLEQLDEPEAGHADEAPRYVKNVLARLRELPVHDREVWLKAIMGEFEQDFSHAKWREGYEQGKFEGAWVVNQLKNADKIRQELNKVKVPQFVADWIEEARKTCKDVAELFEFDFTNDEVGKWFMQERPFDLVARAWLDGYEVEEEKYFRVKVKGIWKNHETLNCEKNSGDWLFSDREENTLYKTKHTRKQLEEAGFGWVFDCEGVEVKEVE